MVNKYLKIYRRDISEVSFINAVYFALLIPLAMFSRVSPHDTSIYLAALS